MLRITLITVVAAALLTIAGCGPTGTSTRQLHEQDSGQSVELRTGDQLEIILDGNPTTGYTWEQTKGNGTIVKLAGEPTYTSESNPVGAGGTYVFRYAAVAPGETTLTLIYHRSFEPDVPPLKTFTAPIVVR